MCVSLLPVTILSRNELLDVGAAVPFTVRPSDLGGVNYALIAIQSSAPDKLQGRFKESLAPFPRDIANWRDYYDWISTDKSTTFYNVSIVAVRCLPFDLCSEIIDGRC
jgi:hypothetical protein